MLGNIDEADQKRRAKSFRAPITTESKKDSEFVMSPGTITPEDLKPWSRESPCIAPIAWASVLNQVPTLKTYKRKASHLQARQSSPKHGRTKGSPSSVPDAIVPEDVHTKCLTPVSPPVEHGIPEDLIHYTRASPSSIPAERSSVVNLSPNAPPSTLLKPPMEISLPRRIIAQRERRAREKLAKANIQPIRRSQIVPGTLEDFMRPSSASMATPRHPSSLMNSRVVPGTPEEVMPLSSASPATTAIVGSSVLNGRVVPGTPEEVMPLSSASPATTAIVRSSVINQGCGQPSLATEALSSSSSSGLKCMMGNLLCCEGQLESPHPGKEKKNGDQLEHLWLKIDPRTPAVEKILPEAVKDLESPMIELVKGNEAEKMAHQSDPSHAGNSSGETILFVKRSVIWKSIESMETFQKMPQNPCFRQLEKLIEWNREGTAIALMVNFDCLVRRFRKFCISDSQSSFNEMLQSLVTFEENGFDVCRIRSCIEELLEIKNNEKKFNEEMTKLQEQILRNIDEESRLDVRNCSLDKTIMEVEQQLASLREERDSVYMQRMTIASETDKLQKDVRTAEESYHSVEQRFNTIVASSW